MLMFEMLEGRPPFRDPNESRRGSLAARHGARRRGARKVGLSMEGHGRSNS